MRYYKIQLPQRIEFNSFPNGSTDPGALNVEMDVQIGPMHTPFGASWLRVWNIPLNLIAQANDFNPSAATSTSLQTITVFGGMQKGLPLAVPAQSGLLFQGGIYQAFGNWQGTDQTLEFRITQSPYSADAPGPFAFTWKKGQNLSALIKSVLSIAFPNYTAPIIKISEALVTNQDQAFYYENLPQFAKWINLVSKAIVTTPNYPGVGISLKPNQAIVLDGTTQTPATKILFTDLIGQMTWIGPQVLNL